MSESPPLCERLDWDSRFFGASIARATIDRIDAAGARTILEWCRAHAVECLYFLADEGDAATARVLVEHGFTAVDVRVTLERQSIPPAAPVPADTRASRLGDIEALREIAAVSHRNSRFYNDGHFDRERCDELYRVWIENSCRGWAEHVVVVERQGAPIGYLTVHVRDTIASIGLIAVDARFKRQGVGRHLLSGALAWIAGRSISRVTVVTQGHNDESQGFFLNAGFRVVSRGVWYHHWFAQRTTADA